MAGTAAGLLAMSGIASADVVVNSLDNTIDNAKEQLALTVGGSASSTQITVNATQDSRESSAVCNVSDTAQLVVNIESDKPDVATVSPSTLTFSACGAPQQVTVTPGKAGVANVDLTKASTSTAGGAFELFTARFQAVVSTPTTAPPPANTKPSVTVTGATDEATYEIGSEPTPSCSVTDAEDGPSTHPAVVTGTLSHGLGELTATCDHTDQGSPALAADTVSVTYSIVDTNAPAIVGSLSPAANAAGWHNTAVAVSFECADDGGSGIKSCAGDTTLTGDGAGQSVTGTATDWADNTSSATVGPVDIDTTDPVIVDDSATTAPTGTAGSNGWFTSDVSVTFRASDNLSGFAGTNNPHTYTRTTSGEGSAVTVGSGTVTDLAGNTGSSVTSAAHRVDLNDPTVTCGAAPTFILGSTDQLVTASVSDTATGSGPASTVASAAVDTSSVGSGTVTVTGHDLAGRSGTASCGYDVVYDWTGFFRPVDNLSVLNAVKAGSAVPVKFNLGGNQGLDVMQAGFPKSQVIDCGSSATVDGIEETVTAGGSSLSYDATAGHYTYVWKTDKAWAGTCRQLVVTLDDGTSHRANFKLLK